MHLLWKFDAFLRFFLKLQRCPAPLAREPTCLKTAPAF
jgi:hypothetical protein